MSNILINVYFKRDVEKSDNYNKDEKNLLILNLKYMQWTSHYINFYNKHQEWDWKEQPSFYFDYKASITLEDLYELIGKSKEEAIEKNFYLAQRASNVEELEDIKAGSDYNLNSFYDEIKSQNVVEKIVIDLQGD
jgi:hypothetical protein